MPNWPSGQPRSRKTYVIETVVAVEAVVAIIVQVGMVAIAVMQAMVAVVAVAVMIVVEDEVAGHRDRDESGQHNQLHLHSIAMTQHDKLRNMSDHFR